MQQTLGDARARRLLRAQEARANNLGVLAVMRDDAIPAIELTREALSLARQRGTRSAQREAVDLGNVGFVWIDMGDLAPARGDLQEACG